MACRELNSPQDDMLECMIATFLRDVLHLSYP